MKTLFILIVLIAIAYLAMPPVTIDKFKTYLPQQKIEQAAQSLLTNVDTKLNDFKQTLSKRQENRISVLEEKIALLERKISPNNTSLHTLAQSKKKSANNTVSSPMEQLALNARKIENTEQLGNSHNYDELLSKANAKTALAANVLVKNTAESNKISMNRQTLLQELAERMNKASLHALTN